MLNFVSALGFLGFALIAWALSPMKKSIRWRPVIGGIGLQLVFAFLVFCMPFSRSFFVFFSDTYTSLIENSREGMTFVFGSLAAKDSPSGFILAFQALPFIIVFASLMSLLYYWGIMQRVIKGFAVIFSHALGTSGAESLCTASNIFVGVESATAVRPYLSKMTDSELFTILVAGMSTVASSMMAVYATLLYKDFPLIAGHLFSASIISAPATFTISKLILPETENPLSMDIHKCEIDDGSESSSSIESILTGAMAGARMAVGVGVSLLAFIAILSILNALIAKISISLGFQAINLQGILAWVFYPFVFLMGVDPKDAFEVARMLGSRVIVTEIPSYIELAKFAESGGSPRTILIASYALCGFAHIGSVAIFVGGISALATEKTRVLSRLGFKALLAATIVTMMTGSVAGLFYWGQNGILKP